MVTMLGLVITIVGSYIIFQGNFLIAGVVVALGALLDSIDGSMARLTNNVSKYGDLLDSVIDRFSEGIVFIGIASYYIYNDLNEFAVFIALFHYCVLKLLVISSKI